MMLSSITYLTGKSRHLPSDQFCFRSFPTFVVSPHFLLISPLRWFSFHWLHWIHLCPFFPFVYFTTCLMSRKKHTRRPKHLNKSPYAADLRRTRLSGNIYKKSVETLMSWNERMESWKKNVYRLSQGQNKPKAINPGLIDIKHGSFGSSAFITQFNFTYTHIA